MSNTAASTNTEDVCRHSRHPMKTTPDFYCVIDFEATCVKDSRISPQEIIEFPAILVNAHDMTPVDHEGVFHSYVKPVIHPQLSDFCTSLTGIEQATVDVAPEFVEVFSGFLAFLESHGIRTPRRPGDKSVLYVTHGDWDLKTMLPSQCALVGLSVAKSMQYWLNIKTIYKALHQRGKGRGHGGYSNALGMASMLDLLGMELIGRYHSGIDDTKNITRILIELARRGAPLNIVNCSENCK